MLHFVSSIESRQVGDTELSDPILCSSTLDTEQLPSKREELCDIKVQELSLSDGEKIYSRNNISMLDIKVFKGISLRKASSSKQSPFLEVIWYEFIRLITGHAFRLDQYEDQITYTRWVCHMAEEEDWLLTLELESNGIVEKLMQLKVPKAQNGELDLFLLSYKLFRNYCKLNDQYINSQANIHKLSSQITTLQQEQEIINRVIEDRDNKTRAIVVELLNSKKRRIAELEDALLQNHGMETSSDVINHYVKNAVSELNSPGKRRKRVANASYRDDESNKRIKTEPPIKRLPEEEDDDFDEFQFYGIDKTQRTRSATPTKPHTDDDIKLESPESYSFSASQENNSQQELSSNPLHKEHEGRQQIADESLSETDVETDAETQSELE